MPPTNLNEYYTSKGQTLPSLTDRAPEFEKAGLGKASEYTGTPEQNTRFLESLMKSGSAPVDNTSTQASITSDQARNDLKQAGDTTAAVTPTMTYDDFKKKYDPSSSAPTAPKYLDTYAKLRQDQGIVALEDEVNKYDEEKANLLADLDKFKREEYKGQSLGFAKGRISEEQQNIQDRIDFINRSQTVAQNKLTTKNKFIENVMSLTEQDYNTSRDAYEKEFNKNAQLQSAFSTEQNRERDDARTTLTTITNMIANSGKSFADLDPAMQAKVSELELQSGMPIGTLKAFATAKPKANLIATQNGTDADGKEFVTFFEKDPDTGVISQSKMYTGGIKDTSVGNTLTLSEAQTMGIPLSLVGKTEAEIAKDLSSETPPSWFNDIPEIKALSESGADERAIQAEWDLFKEALASKREA